MLSQVAHELRTPLNCIINLLELCLEAEDYNYKGKYLMPSLKSAKLLQNLI
jgi:signal transduction histidine kinase